MKLKQGMPLVKRLRHQVGARRDLLDIWNYTSLTWSRMQADAYLTELDRVMAGLANGSVVGQRYAKHYRRRAVGAHVIFYRENAQEVVIVRVLHARMDIARHLPD